MDTGPADGRLVRGGSATGSVPSVLHTPALRAAPGMGAPAPGVPTARCPRRKPAPEPHSAVHTPTLSADPVLSLTGLLAPVRGRPLSFLL